MKIVFHNILQYNIIKYKVVLYKIYNVIRCYIIVCVKIDKLNVTRFFLCSQL